MGTAQATFEVDRAVDRTIAHDRNWHDRKWRQSRDRKWHQSSAKSGSIFCACATGSCVISALVRPFDRKWQSHVTGSRFCAYPAFSRAFFLVVVTWLPKVTWTPSGFPCVCACATGSCATPVVTEGHVTPFGNVHGVFSTTSASFI
jgi:hypothetical protein